jgi:hypothetical protein
MSNRGFGFGVQGASGPVPFGCSTYGTAGTYTFTVPSGVSKISVVCVGGGQTGAQRYCCDDCNCGAGGAGGSLSYTNCIPVTAGESLTVVVGVGGAATVYSPSYQDYGAVGTASTVSRGSCTLIRAIAGFGAFMPAPAANTNIGAVSYTGGGASCTLNFNRGGGGAGGYAGKGGLGAHYGPFPPGLFFACAGTGGSGGGGGATKVETTGAGGGGVGLIVQGPSGAAGSTQCYTSNQVTGGGGGSAGSAGQSTQIGGNFGYYVIAGVGGAYGGGGGASASYSLAVGAAGGVRIIYGGTGKSYPTNSAP